MVVVDVVFVDHHYRVGHGDDFVSAGLDKEFKWMKIGIEKTCEVNTQVLSAGARRRRFATSESLE